jgi:uncharacterized protein
MKNMNFSDKMDVPPGERDKASRKGTRRGMVTQQAIQELAQAIVREFQPKSIILFGSYAYEQPRPDSDVDLLVIKRLDSHPVREALQILDRLKPRFGVDLLVRSSEDVRFRLAGHDAFLEEITGKGTILYDAAD